MIQMLKCAECGTPMKINNSTFGDVIECSTCGIDLQLGKEKLFALQLGPSEE